MNSPFKKTLFLIPLLLSISIGSSLSIECVDNQPSISKVEGVNEFEVKTVEESGFKSDKIKTSEKIVDLERYDQVVNSYFEGEMNFSNVEGSNWSSFTNLIRDDFAGVDLEEGDVLISGPPGACNNSFKALYSSEGEMKLGKTVQVSSDYGFRKGDETLKPEINPSKENSMKIVNSSISKSQNFGKTKILKAKNTSTSGIKTSYAFKLKQENEMENSLAELLKKLIQKLTN